jgi:catechol 2,3-dioxygenase
MTTTREATSTLIDHIARVDLRVRDIDSSLGFYRDVVGLEVVDRGDETVSLRSPEGPVFLTLRSSGVTAPADPSATGLYHIAIRFPTRAALGDALARLVAADYRIGAGDHGVSEALYIDDPDGNGVELYRDRPVEEWPAPAGDALVGMTTGPVDMQGVLDSGRGREALDERAASGTDMGHVHLQASDVDKTVAFYRDELGLDLTQMFGGSAAFLSSNGYHHHIGANTWNSRGSSAAAPEHAGLDRIVFAVGDADRLERVRLRLAEHGRRPEGTENELLSVRDPDGIELHFIVR